MEEGAEKTGHAHESAERKAVKKTEPSGIGLSQNGCDGFPFGRFDMARAVAIVPEKVIDFVRELVVAKVKFDDSLFTRRELRLMRELSVHFADELTKPLIGFTHEERGPWDKIWDSGRGNDERIPYTLAISDDDPNRAAILEAAREYEGIVAAGSNRH